VHPARLAVPPMSLAEARRDALGHRRGRHRPACRNTRRHKGDAAVTHPTAVATDPVAAPAESITVDVHRVGRHRSNHVYLVNPNTDDRDQDEEVAVALIPGYGPVIRAALNYYAQAIAAGLVPVDTPEDSEQ
jgi:hypothetical protein